MSNGIDYTRFIVRAKLVAKEEISIDYYNEYDKVIIIGSELATLRLAFCFRDKNIYQGKNSDGRYYFEMFDFSLAN